MTSDEIIELYRQRFEQDMVKHHPNADIRRQDVGMNPGYVNTCADWAWRGYLMAVLYEVRNARS